jgi:hypothetical protein
VYAAAAAVLTLISHCVAIHTFIVTHLHHHNYVMYDMMYSQLIVAEGEQYSIYIEVGGLSTYTLMFNVIEGPLRPSSTGGVDVNDDSSTSVLSYILYIGVPLVIVVIILWKCVTRYRHRLLLPHLKRNQQLGGDILPLVAAAATPSDIPSSSLSSSSSSRYEQIKSSGRAYQRVIEPPNDDNDNAATVKLQLENDAPTTELVSL